MGRMQGSLAWLGHGLVWVGLSVAVGGCTATPKGGDTAASSGNIGVAGQAAKQLCVQGNTVERVAPGSCASQSVVSSALDRVTLDLAPKTLSLSLFEGISVGASYKYRVQPSYLDEYFTRLDTYTLTRGAQPGDLLGVAPLKIGLKRDSKVVFAQQFARGVDARNTLNTYLPDRLPLTAMAAKSLKLGDYVRFDAELGLTASTSQVWPLAGFLLSANAGVSVLLDGEYQVHLFRLDGNRIRLKLVAERARQNKVSASVGVAPRVRGALLHHATGRLLPLAELAKFDAKAGAALTKTTSNLFLVDYTIDLDRPEAAAAFDLLFSNPRNLADFQIANPLRNTFALQNRLIGSIEELDLLARRDLDHVAPAIQRNFQGSNLASSRGVSLQVRLNTYDVKRARVFRENFLTRTELVAGQPDERSYYLLPNWSQLRERSMLFGMLDENQVRTADALFIADEQGQPQRFLNIGFSFEYQDRLLRPSEYRRLRRKLELLLPQDAEAELVELMQGTNWLDDVSRRNLSLSLRYFFREGAFDALVGLGYGEPAKLRQALADFVVRGIENGEFPYYRKDLPSFIRTYSAAPVAVGAVAQRRQAAALAAQHWSGQFSRVAEQLALAFTAGDDNSARMSAILGLRNNGFYRKVGTAFWADLLDQSHIALQDVMYLQMSLTAKDHQGLEYQYGIESERALYDSVKLIEKLLNDRSFDMRELGAIETVISRMTVVGS